jgi:hypothetical protein
MSIRKLLKEQSKSDFTTKYKDKLSLPLLSSIVKYIQPEYWDWVANKFPEEGDNINLINIIDLTQKFERLKGVLQTTDINKFGSYEDLKNQIDSFTGQYLNNMTTTNNKSIIFEDDKLLIVSPSTQSGACYYGKDSVGCVDVSSENSFNITYGEYGDKKIVYLINKNNPEEKITIVFVRNSKPYFYVKNVRVGMEDVLNSIPNFNVVYSFIISFLERKYEDKMSNLDYYITKTDIDKKEQEKRIAQEKRLSMEEANERRIDKEWELGPDCPTIGLMAHALFDYLVSEGEIESMSEDDEERRTDILERISELQEEYENSDTVRYDLLSQIEQLEEELDEFKEYKDVYDLIPLESQHYGMQKFATELYGDEYTVGTETEMDDALREYVEDMVETEGYDGFASWVKDNAINEDEILNWFDDYFNQDVYQEPDAYLDDSQRQLDSKQVETIKIIDARVLQTQREIERLEEIKYGIDDEDKVDKIDDRISQLEDYITELEEQKQEIEENPEGDYSDDDIEDMIETKLEEVRYNPTGSANDYGLDLDDFIDKEKFIDTVIDNESYDMMSHNDGAVHEETVQGETYYIIKL